MLEAIFVLYFCLKALTGAILRHPSWKREAMTNEEKLALLKAGVEGWNKWRKENNGVEINLMEADLSSANLGSADLMGADLRQANLMGADLSQANLRGAYLVGADFSRADLIDADLSQANLMRACLKFANLSGANLSEANLGKALLREAKLNRANLSGANLSEANCPEASLPEVNLSGVDLIEANLSEADLCGADLRRAYLRGANLTGANLIGANLTGANLSEANLINSNLVNTDITNAKISKSNVYGVNVWDLEGEFKEQKDLIITPQNQPPITVDNIKVAQFVYLILNNREIREVINTLTSKSVLILGRFAIPERKAILDALRDKLREYDLLPIVFDFERPTDKDFTETIKTLAGLCYFVIADVTNPRSSPLELQATIPDYQIPFVPIIQEGENPFAMMVDLQKKYNWVLDTISYDSLDTLIEILKPHIIDPAIKKRDELRLIKAKEPTIISGRELRSKGKP
jgi:uncharacterized protein YjbI with pentapeptide repeats